MEHPVLVDLFSLSVINFEATRTFLQSDWRESPTLR